MKQKFKFMAMMLMGILLSINSLWAEGECTSWNLATSSYNANPTEELISWSGSCANMSNAKGESTTKVTNYIPTTQSSTRFYQNQVLTITPVGGANITTIVFTATTESYATAFKNSTWNNASTDIDTDKNAKEIIIVPTDGTSAVTATIGATCGFTKVDVYASGGTTYNITYHVGAVSGTVSNVGSGTILSAALSGIETTSSDATSTTFMGWSESSFSGKTDVAPTLLTGTTRVNKDLELWAVWAQQTTGVPENKTATFTIKQASAPGSPWTDASGAQWTYSGTITFENKVSAGMANGSKVTVQLPQGAIATSMSMTGAGNSWSTSNITLTLTAQGVSGSLATFNNHDGTYNFTAANKGARNYTLGCTTQSSKVAYVGSIVFNYTVPSITYAAYTTCAPAYTVSAVANDGALGSVSVSGNVITATPNECVGYEAPAYTVTSGTASVAQDGNTFTVTPSENCEVTINFAATAEDTYLDNVQGWTASEQYCGSYTVPSIADKTPVTSGSCEEVHYHFIGWTTAKYRNSPTGHITEAGAAMTASGTTYYAVWAKEAE